MTISTAIADRDGRTGRRPSRSLLLALAVIAIYVALLGVLVVNAIIFDTAREGTGPAGGRTVALGPQSAWLLDFETIEPHARIFDADVANRFQPADGTMPVTGMQYLRNGALWLKFTMPAIDGDDQIVLRLSDPRVRQAWLLWKDGDRVVERGWSFDDAARVGGEGTRTPVFVFDAREFAGREMVLGFTSLSILRGYLFAETRSSYLAWEIEQTVRPSFFAGALVAIAIYLAATGMAFRDGALIAASVMSLALMTVIFGGSGLFHTYVMPASPSMADIVAYLPKPFVISAWLVFIVIYLRLARGAPRTRLLLLSLAFLIPFQSVIAGFKVGLDWDIPGQMTSVGPTLVSMGAGLIVLLFYAWKGSRRARIILLCWSPLALGTIVRTVFIFDPNETTARALANDPFIDIVASMTALAVAMVVDMQARERVARLAAESSEQRLRGFSTIASRSFFELDGAGKITSAFGPLVDALGIAPGGRLGSALVARAPGAAGDLIARMEGAAVQNRGFRNHELRVEERAGESARWYAFSVEPWRDSLTGSGLRGTIEDVTDDIDRRAGLEQQGRFAAMGRVAGGIAHEVNNLLHPIVNLARRVRDHHVTDDEARKMLDLVIDSGRQAGAVVEGVLESVSPVGARRGPALPLAAALERALSASKATLPPGVRLAQEIERIETPAVAVGEMLQVVGNLLANAVQAIEHEGAILVRLASDGAGAVLRVADNGAGMPEDIRVRALEPFVTARRDGTGLGLSMVAAIAAGWGGTVEIASTEGVGTTVTIRLPGSNIGTDGDGGNG